MPGRNAADIVREHTVLARPLLVPELRLFLITPSRPLWHASEVELRRLGLDDPFWGFCWPGGQALARHVLDHPDLVAGRRVLDIGTGCGVVALAASLAGAAHVTAIDKDPVAVAATRLNADRNGLVIEVDAADICQIETGDWDVLLAGDMTYEAELTHRVMGKLRRAAANGTTVLVADPDRSYLPTQEVELIARLEAPAEVDVSGQYVQATSIYRL